MRIGKGVKYIRQHGLRGFIVRLYQKFWPLHKSHVYWWDEHFVLTRTPDLAIRRYTKIDDVEDSVFETLNREGVKNARQQYEHLFRSGSELWLAFAEGRLAGISWSTTGRDREDYYVSLGRQDATIYGCLVFDSFRGRGIYPAMLKHIVDVFLEKGKRRIYEDIKQWNESSIRGIKKTGIRYLGTAWRLKLGSWTHVFGRSWEGRSTPYGKRGLFVRCVYLMAAILWWIISGFGLFGRKGTVVLCYHTVLPPQESAFRRQMKQIQKRAVQRDQLPVEGIRLGEPLKVCVTFDDAYASLQSRALPVLQGYGIASVIFVPVDHLNQLPGWDMPDGHPECRERICSEAELKEIAQDELVTIGSHSCTHPDLTAITTDAVRYEMEESWKRLEAITEREVKDFAFPYGRYSPDLLDAAEKVSYRRIFTLDPEIVRSNEGTLGRFSMTPDVWPIEFKLTVAGAYIWLNVFRKCLRQIRGPKGSNHS